MTHGRARAMHRRLRARSPTQREELAERIAGHLDMPITAGGVVFLLLVLAETISRPEGAVGTAFTVMGWMLWALFALEFVVRMVIAPSTSTFLRHNWWQVVFLVVPAFRFVRGLRALRAARVGRVLSSAIRSSRSAGRKLSSRLATLGATTTVVVLASSQVLFELGRYDTYSAALHAAALATIAGEPLSVEQPFLQVVELIVVTYSVVVFATLAGAVGAYLLERRDEHRRRHVPDTSPTAPNTASE